jgi:formylmethanofuran dehydrogenase subunit C
MNDRILTPFLRNDFKWTGKQEEENRTIKMQFKQAMTRLKESFRIEYEADEFEELIEYEM